MMMVRKALSLKTNNVIPIKENKQNDVKNEKKQEKIEKEPIVEKKEKKMWPLFETRKKTFEVYEDPKKDPEVEEEIDKTIVKETDKEIEKEIDEDKDNNIIHELERKLEQRIRDGIPIIGSKRQREELKKRMMAPELRKKTKATIPNKATRDAWMFAAEDYFHDMLRYLMRQQTKHRPNPNYLSNQKDVNVGMRTILVDWLNDVILEYRLREETFHLAVNIVDRVMSIVAVSKEQLQLVGTSALLIAAKYEEVYVPEIEEFSIITKHTYKIDDILRMERFILAKLDFVVAPPTSIWFGNCFANRLNFTLKMKMTLEYLLVLSLIEINFLRQTPSTIAAAAVCFTNIQSEMAPWPPEIEKDTNIKEEEFGECLYELHSSVTKASKAKHHWVFRKYSTKEFEQVALMPAPTEKLHTLFPSVFNK